MHTHEQFLPSPAFTWLKKILTVFFQFLIYGIPAAGVLVTELHHHTFSRQLLPSAKPRSEIIRILCVFVSWFQNSEMLPTVTTGACVELSGVIGRLLDDTLNHQFISPNPVDNQGTTEPVTEGAKNGPHESALGIPSEAYGSGVASEEFLSWLDELDLDIMRPGMFI